MAVFILEDALSVWTNLGKHLLFVWLCVSGIKTPLAHTKMGNTHCTNERLHFLPSYRLSYGKIVTLYVTDVQFVDVNVLFYILYLIYCSNKMCTFYLIYTTRLMRTPR